MVLATHNKIEIIKAVRDVAQYVRDYHHDNEVRRSTYAPHIGYDADNYPAQPWTYEAFSQFTRKVLKVSGMGLNVETIIASPQLVGLKECKDWVEANVDFYAVGTEEVFTREKLQEAYVFAAGTRSECQNFVASAFANVMAGGGNQSRKIYYIYECETMRVREAISFHITH